MKRILLLIIASLAISCGGGSSQKSASTGRPYELLVVAEPDIYRGEVGDTLKAIFGQEVLWLSQPEPIFDLLSIPLTSVNNVSQRHRNLMFVNIDPKFAKSDMTAEYDKFAAAQLVLNIDSPSADSAANFIGRYQNLIIKMLEKTERDRFVARAKEYGTPGIEKVILNRFGINLSIPRGFRVRVEKDNYMWISNEMPLASQGIVIYTFDAPAAMDSMWVVRERNVAVNQIPGPVEGSYMSTATEFFPETQLVLINERQWYQTNGFWFVNGDWMGGPFVNFVTKIEGSNKYLGLDFYVQSPSPRFGKRNYIKQLEALPLTVSFDKAGGVQVKN